MKRIICILSLLAMIVFLCACGGLNTNNDEGPQDTDHLAEQFEEVNLISVNEDEAQENGGLYILFKNQYYPLQCGGWAVNSYRENINMVFTDENTESIPVLKESSKLVYFSENKVEEYYTAIPVVETGFTIPAEFSDPAQGKSNLYELDVAIQNYDQEKEVKETESLTAESINGGSYQKFFLDHTFHSNKFCSAPTDSMIGGGCRSTDDYIWANLKKNEEVVFSYHEGSAYKENTVLADIKYYGFDGCKKDVDGGEEYTGIKMVASLSEKPYAELDTSSLENGIYVIPITGDGVIYPNLKRFIFEVKR